MRWESDAGLDTVSERNCWKEMGKQQRGRKEKKDRRQVGETASKENIEKKRGGKKWRESERKTERENVKEKEKPLACPPLCMDQNNLSLTSLDPSIDAYALCNCMIFGVCVHTVYPRTNGNVPQL